MKVAIVGKRSWIARALLKSFIGTSTEAHYVEKYNLKTLDFSDYEVVYLILGRAKPSPQEQLKEEQDLGDFIANTKPPKRAVYFSSRNLTESKAKCEVMISYAEKKPRELGPKTNFYVIRPPAIFGRGQDIDSEMLIPSLGRDGDELVINKPNSGATFIHISEIVNKLHDYTNESIFPYLNKIEIQFTGSFIATPKQLQNLWKTWDYYSRMLGPND